MARYNITFKRSVKKDFRRISNRDIPATLHRIDALAEQPRPVACKKLSSKEVYRVRQGNYRIIYEIFDDELVVLVVTVANCSIAYRGQ